MPRVPDDHQPQQPSLDGLRHQYPDWQIDPPAQLHVWTAELKSDGGRCVHFLAGHDLRELAERLATATAIAP